MPYIILFLLCGHYLFPNNIKPFYTETLTFKVKWTLLTVGKITMQSYIPHKNKKKNQLKIYVKIKPFKQMKSFYYVEGRFGSIWNYKLQKPIYAFEEIFQGKYYAKRSFRFNNNDVKVSWLEKKFTEYHYPHTKKGTNITRNETRNIDAKGIQDLLGAFYYIRSLNFNLKKGQVQKIKILPAGSHKMLILKILNIYTTKVPFFGKKKVLHVRTALGNINSQKKGGNIFLNTQSNIELWVTYDKNFVPVKFKTELPYIGEVNAILEKYSQP